MTGMMMKKTSLAAGLGMLSLLAAAGCGGTAQPPDDAVLVSSPDANTAAPAPGVSPAPADSAPAAPTATAPAASKSDSAAPTVKAEGFGTFKGKVVFGGAAPEPKVLVAKGDTSIKDPAVCAAQPIASERLLVGGDGGVRYALVYIPKPTAVSPEAKSEAEATEVIFDQKNCVFEPHVLGVMTGSKILIKSSDAVGHNVNSKVANNTINTAIAAGGEFPFTTQAAARAPGQVVCDIHNWMTAYWMVVDSPYITVTDAEGNFELKNVPAGTQKIVVWQEAVGFVTAPSGQEIQIAANGETTQEFKIDPGKVKAEN